MKKLFFCFLFISSLTCFSQTISEKWNSLDERYDYTDSNGNLVGYKRYNSLDERWEYTSVNSSNASYNPYGNNLKLYADTMSAKQARHYAGLERVTKYVRNLKVLLQDDPENMQQFEDKIVSKLRNNVIDYSSSSEVNRVIDYLTKGFDWVLKN